MARHFENWLAAYVQHTRASESPSAFHFWTGVSTIAGALRRRVWIDEKLFQWTPNFYIILVAPPGVASKSTSMRLGSRLLDRVPGIKFGPVSMTWQALTVALEDAFDVITYPSEHGEDLKLPMSCLTINISELGTFLKPQDQALVDALTALYDGQLETWGHATKTQGNVEIKNPWINLIGCTTPTWLKMNVPEHMIGGGLTSRVIFVYADKKRQLVAYPSRHIEGASYKIEEDHLVEDLLTISTLCGEYKLTPEAYAVGEAWYEKHWTQRENHLASERYGGYLARKQTHIHKLAMVLAAAQRNRLVIEAEDISAAIDLITEIEADMLKVYESVGVVAEAKHVQEIARYVETLGFQTSQELFALCRNVMSQKDFEAAIKAAVEGGVLTKTTSNGRVGVVLAKRQSP